MKMKNFYLTTLGILTFTSLPVFAAPLSPEQALERVNASGGFRAPARNALSLVHTGMQPSSEMPAFYIFENDGHAGFIIVSADDNAMPLLATVDEGAFDTADMPPAFEYWLSEYARQIEFAANAPAPVPQVTSHKVVAFEKRNDVGPLCKARWAQGYPFNNDCPKINGSSTKVGCVATAMAQAMKVYNWPPKGNGSISYKWNGKTNTMDFGEQEYDWDNMLDSYNNGSTAAQNKAVAKLNAACAYSTRMQFGAYESSAYAPMVGAALRDFFGYAMNGVLKRDAFTTTDWTNIMYEELAAGRPIVYSGVSTSNTGHCFLCDGYAASSGLFHINWGWSGSYNGYFALSALNPEGVGTGGGSGEYNYEQDAVVGIAPSGTPDVPTYLPFYANGSFTFDANYAGGRNVIKLMFTNGALYNKSGIGFNAVTLGLMVMKDGVEVTTWSGPLVSFKEMDDDGTISGYSNFTSDSYPNRLEPGVYTVYPACYIRAFGWYRIPVFQGCRQYIYLTVDENGNGTYSNDAPDFLADLEVSEFSIPSEVRRNDSFDLTFEYRNGKREFIGEIYLVGKDSDNKMYPFCTVGCELAGSAKGSSTVTVQTDVPEGEYTVCFVNQAGTVLSAEAQVKVVDPVKVSEIEMSGENGKTFYDLSGKRVSNDTEGIILERSKAGTKKVVIKK